MKDIEFNQERIRKISRKDLEYMSSLKNQTSTGRFRFCLHEDESIKVQELINVWSAYAYFQPHYHPEYAETKVILNGNVLVLIFNDKGDVIEHFIMERGGIEVLRLAPGVVHTNIPLSETVFLEYTQGPFVRDKGNKYLDIFPDKMNENDVRAFVSPFIEDIVNEGA